MSTLHVTDIRSTNKMSNLPCLGTNTSNYLTENVRVPILHFVGTIPFKHVEYSK